MRRNTRSRFSTRTKTISLMLLQHLHANAICHDVIEELPRTPARLDQVADVVTARPSGVGFDYLDTVGNGAAHLKLSALSRTRRLHRGIETRLVIVRPNNGAWCCER